MYMCIYIYIFGCGSKPWLSRGTPRLLQTFVAGPLLQTLVADLCVEYCSLQGACRGGVCRRTPQSVTNLCREMAAQACYKANFLIRCHIYTHTRHGKLRRRHATVSFQTQTLRLLLGKSRTKSKWQRSPPLHDGSATLLRNVGQAKLLALGAMSTSQQSDEKFRPAEAITVQSRKSSLSRLPLLRRKTCSQL